MKISLGILDQGPLREDKSLADSLQETLELAQYAEKLGYKRFWVSEHHDRDRFAIRSPELLMAILLANTKMKIGAGGIMLLNHSPMRIAECFQTLQSIYGERIELSFGRAPGGPPLETDRLRRHSAAEAYDFIQRLDDFYADLDFLKNNFYSPDLNSIWLLSSSFDSTKNAAMRGMNLVYGQFINSKDTIKSVEYFHQERPELREKTMLGLVVVCSDDEEELRILVQNLGLHYLNILQNPKSPIPSLMSSTSFKFTAEHKEMIKFHIKTAGVLVGNSAEIRNKISAISERTGCLNPLLISYGYDKESRIRNYASISKAFELADRILP